MRYITYGILILSLSIVAITPTSTMTASIVKLQEFIKSNKHLSPAEIDGGIASMIKPMFALDEIARRSVGYRWTEFSEGQKVKFNKFL